MDTVFFIQALKKELKSSQVNYRDLAKHLQMSEAGVKKLLNKNDLSMSRAHQICNAIGISVYDVMRASEEDSMHSKKFNQQQVNFFLENINYFKFYMRLAYEQKSPEEIQLESGLSDKSLFRYLKKLDDLKLIKLLQSNKVSFPGGVVWRVETAGTALEKLKNELINELLKRVEKTKIGKTFGGIFFLSQSEQVQLENDLEEVHNKFSKRSLANRSLKRIKKNPDYSTYTAMMILSPSSLFEGIRDI